MTIRCVDAARRMFGLIKLRYRGVKKNAAQFLMLQALANLWVLRG